MIPDELRPDTESQAERRLFDRIRDETSNDIVAFHSVAWLVPGRNGKPRRGESDFVLAHPEHGVVTLEVKGGSIRFDAHAGKWFSGGKEGEFGIKDPLRQAERTSFLLRDSLARARRSGAEGLAFGHAIAFPDTRAGHRALRPDIPREILVVHRDLDKLGEKIDSLFRYWHRGDEAPLGEEGVRRLESLLANSFELPAPLGYALEDTQRDLLRLTEEQYFVLDMLARHPRAAIAGCAGSGKSFLAAEKARRLAGQGFRVLVCCYNRLLSEHLRRGLADVEEIDVVSFDGLCLSVVREAGIDFSDEPPEEDQGRYWRDLRLAFADTVDIAAGRYGALIVDEAQDFDEDWWVPLQLLLEDPDRSPLYIFYDDNQRIFAVPKNLPVPDEPFVLTRNCRNTQAINKIVNDFYKGETIEALGPQGVPIEAHFYRSEGELLEQLDMSVHKWVEEADVEPAQIALLTPKSAARSALWRVDALGGVRLTDDPWDDGKVLRSSIYRFKGLERLVVAMAELDGAKEAALYVGFSRANVFLSIFCPESARKRLPKELALSA